MVQGYVMDRKDVLEDIPRLLVSASPEMDLLLDGCVLPATLGLFIRCVGCGAEERLDTGD